MVYPNPFSQEINIELPESLDEPITYTLYGPLGRIIHQKALTSKKYNIGTRALGPIPQGVYLLEIRSVKWVKKYKLVKE